jgi:hypothetical protein
MLKHIFNITNAFHLFFMGHLIRLPNFFDGDCAGTSGIFFGVRFILGLEKNGECVSSSEIERVCILSFLSVFCSSGQHVCCGIFFYCALLLCGKVPIPHSTTGHQYG